jgi:hypothetical protein
VLMLMLVIFSGDRRLNLISVGVGSVTYQDLILLLESCESEQVVQGLPRCSWIISVDTYIRALGYEYEFSWILPRYP